MTEDSNENENTDLKVQAWGVGSNEEAVLLCSLLTGAKESYGYDAGSGMVLASRASLLRVLDEFNRFGIEAGVLDKPQVI